MLRSLVCVNLTFVQGDNCGPICIRAHVEIQLDLHHLLKMLTFLHCMPSLLKSSVVGV